jgi:hypothetical protein
MYANSILLAYYIGVSWDSIFHVVFDKRILVSVKKIQMKIPEN